MKLVLYILVSLSMLFTSCGKWLDVQPSDTVSQDQMYKEGDGFRIALNGVYKSMSTESLYGCNLTWGLVSACGNDYTLGYGGIDYYHSWYYIANDYKYREKDAVETFDRIWKSAYKSIVNCNNLIGKLRTAEVSIFKQKEFERNLILGEALAARATLHFDILRLYAPAPIHDDKNIYIPYYDQDGLSSGQARSTVTDVLNKTVKDLIAAQELLEVDAVNLDRVKMLNPDIRFVSKYPDPTELDKDPFFTCRGYRLNYTAATALLARVYNYMGRHKEAFIEAKKIVDMKYDKVYSVFAFTKNNDADINRKLTGDLIFTLSVPKLYDNYNKFGSGSSQLTISSSLKYDDPADYRQVKLIGKNENNRSISLKNVKPEVGSNSSVVNMISDMVPVVRVSEMFYIIAEYYASQGMYDQAKTYIDMVRIGRNCTAGKLQISDAKSFQNELLNEVRREFVGEAQTYFYYKKFGVKIQSKMTDEHWMFPIPIDENI